MQLIETDILSLLPQRPPFIMVDRLIHFDPVVTRTELKITENNIFCSEGTLLPAGLIENIAQTCAARIGYINSHLNEEIKIGVIGAVQNLEIISLPSVGDMLETEIIVSDIIFSVTIVDAFVRCKGNIVAKCNMKIAIIEDNNEKN